MIQKTMFTYSAQDFRLLVKLLFLKVLIAFKTFVLVKET